MFDEINNMVDSCANLDDLFMLWKKAHVAEENYEETTVTDTLTNKSSKTAYGGISKDSFIKDGYIDEESYKKASKKILFILKEANIQAYRSENDLHNPSEASQICFYRNYICSEEEKPKVLNTPRQQEKMGRIAHYIFTGSKIADIKEVKNALKCCAFMNINKRGGSNKASKVNAYLSKYQKFVNKQIEILSPDFIIIVGKTIDTRFISSNGAKIIVLNHTADYFHGTYRVEKYVDNFIDKYTK